MQKCILSYISNIAAVGLKVCEGEINNVLFESLILNVSVYVLTECYKV